MPVTPPSYDPNARAKTAADVKYGAAEAQLNRSIESARMQEAAQKAALDQYGAAGRQVIGETYGDLYGNLAENRRDTNAQLGTQVGLVGQGYRDAGALGNQARADSAQRLATLAGTLGLSGQAQSEVNTGIEQLAAQILSNSAQDDATRSGNLRTWAAQQDAFLGQGEAQAQREGAERKGSFEDELVRALAGMQADFRQREFDQQGSLLDLLNERGSFQTSAADQYSDNLFSQGLQAFQANLSEQEAQAQAAARQAAQALAERQFAASQSGNDLEDFLNLAQNARAEKSSALDNLLKQKQLNQVDPAQTLDEWGAQNNATDLIDELLQTYNSININRNKVQGILDSDQVQGNVGKIPKEYMDLYNYYGTKDPSSLFVEDFNRMYGNKSKLTDAQLRTALPYILGMPQFKTGE